MNPIIEGTFAKKGEEESFIDDFEIDKENEELAFEVLSSQMYSNKEKVVVQEYMCNARDAHREAGKCQTPIEVILPTDQHLFFEVIDYGLGISVERMNKIFRKYFASSKRDEKGIPQTGGYGLGSKCAWAYCDEFWVTTINDSMEYEYHCYKDEKRKRRISLISKSIITPGESSGTTIKVPVQAKDIALFDKNYRHVTEFWGVKPEVYLMVDGKKEKTRSYFLYAEEYDLVGEFWKLKFNEYTVRTATAVVDDIQYPIVYDMLAVNNPIFRNILNENIYIEFARNEVVVSPNREQLQYTADTQKNIISKLEIISQELMTKFLDGIKEYTSIKDVRRGIHDNKVLKQIYKKLDCENQKLKWNDVVIECKSISTTPFKENQFFKNVSFKKYSSSSYDNHGQVRNYDVIEWDSLDVLIINDKKSEKPIKMLDLMAARKGFTSANVINVGKIIKEQRKNFYIELEKLYGLKSNDYIILSDYIKKTVPKSVVTKTEEKLSIKGVFRYARLHDSRIREKELDLSEYAGVYAEVHYCKKLKIGDRTYDPTEYEIIAMMEFIGVTECLLIPPKLMESVIQLKNLGHIKEVAERKYAADSTTHDLDSLYVRKHMSDQNLGKMLYAQNADQCELWLKTINKDIDNPLLNTYFESKSKLATLTPTESQLLTYCISSGHMNNSSANHKLQNSDLKNAVFAIHQKYPLLTHVLKQGKLDHEIAKELCFYILEKEKQTADK